MTLRSTLNAALCVSAATAAVLCGACSPAGETASTPAPAAPETVTPAAETAAPVAETDSGSSAVSQVSGPDPLAPVVRQWITDARTQCVELGGIFRERGAIQYGDFNGDGKRDYLLSQDGLMCTDNEMLFEGGTRGSTHEIAVSQGDTYVMVDEGILAHDAEIAQRNGRTVILTPDHEDPRIKHHWVWNGTRMARTGETDGPLYGDDH